MGVSKCRAAPRYGTVKAGRGALRGNIRTEERGEARALPYLVRSPHQSPAVDRSYEYDVSWTRHERKTSHTEDDRCHEDMSVIWHMMKHVGTWQEQYPLPMNGQLLS